MADLSTLQIWLTEAETARHKLMTGSLEERVQQGDMALAYTKSEVSKLDAYISDLKAQIAALGGTVSGARRRGIVVDL